MLEMEKLVMPVVVSSHKKPVWQWQFALVVSNHRSRCVGIAGSDDGLPFWVSRI